MLMRVLEIGRTRWKDERVEEGREVEVGS